MIQCSDCRADYDLISFTPTHGKLHYLTSSYVYRKALIRKHQLHNTHTEYLAKCAHRKVTTPLRDAVPRGWAFELQFADELDELLVDELGELRVEMQAESSRQGGQRRCVGFPLGCVETR